jgi:hypothetical protein
MRCLLMRWSSGLKNMRYIRKVKKEIWYKIETGSKYEAIILARDEAMMNNVDKKSIAGL